MKRILSHMSVLCLIFFSAKAQSKVEFQSGTIIEVQAGADISADTVIINGTFLGDGTINHVPLPVELTSFTAAVFGNNIELHWKTATEVNNYGFNIERRLESEDRSQNQWKYVGFVAGQGNSTSPKEYMFLDEKLSPGKYCYRLKQMDYDGTFVYSETIEAEAALPKKFALFQNYPNPFNPSTVIKYQMPFEGHVSLIVYDILGNEVMILTSENKEAGYYETNFNGSALASGTYICRLNVQGIAGNYISVKKMLLLR